MKCIQGEVLQRSLPFYLPGTQKNWGAHPQRIPAETKAGCCLEAPTEASGNLNGGFLNVFWVAHIAEIWQSPFLTQGHMHNKKLTCVIPLQLHVLYRHVIRSPKGIKNLQEYDTYNDDSNHNQILNIIFSILVFTRHNLKLWLLYKCTLAFKDHWMSLT